MRNVTSCYLSNLSVTTRGLRRTARPLLDSERWWRAPSDDESRQIGVSESAQDMALQSFGNPQYMLISAEIIVPNFRKPSSEKSLRIPPKAQASSRRVAVSIHQRKSMCTTRGHLACGADPGITFFEGRKRCSVAEDLLKRHRLTGLTPCNTKSFDRFGIVHNFYAGAISSYMYSPICGAPSEVRTADGGFEI